MKLPDQPNFNAPISARWLRQWLLEAVDYLRAITPMPSPEVWPDVKPAGTTYLLKPRPQQAPFSDMPTTVPVTVAKDGGADGSASTRASWTYTISSIAGAELATEVAVVKPRPLGKRHYGDELAAEGALAYGLAFRDADGNWKLWDAGETRRQIAAMVAVDSADDMTLRFDDVAGDFKINRRRTLIDDLGEEDDEQSVGGGADCPA